MKVNLNVSGFDLEAIFPDQEVKKIHQPLIEKFTRMYNQKQERVIIFLCAPPGSGKSTLAAFWEYLSEHDESLEPVQVLPFDGFHFPNDILDTNNVVRNGKEVTLRSIKGSYETFNLTELIYKLKQLNHPYSKWPFYDRNLHDPVDDAISVNRNIVIVEGNWLLLDEPVWNGLHRLADFSIFIDTQPEFLQQRLVERKVRGGADPESAMQFYLNSDAVNVDKVLSHSLPADLTLLMHQDGSFDIR